MIMVPATSRVVTSRVARAPAAMVRSIVTSNLSDMDAMANSRTMTISTILLVATTGSVLMLRAAAPGVTNFAVVRFSIDIGGWS